MPTLVRTPTLDAPPAPDPVARRLADLKAAPAAAFAVPAAGGGSHPARLAAHCPDLFLVAAPLAVRADFAAEVVALAVRAGQRVLVLGHYPDALFTAIARRCTASVGRAVGPAEVPARLPHAAHTAAARAGRHREIVRAEVQARVSAAEGRVREAERRDDLRAELDHLEADFARIPEQAAAAVEASDDLRQLARTRAAAVASAHHAKRQALEAEIAELKKQATQPAGNFFTRLLGGGHKPAESQSKLAAAESQLHELLAHPPADGQPAFDTGRAALLQAEEETRRAALQPKLDDRRRQLDAHAAPPTADARRDHASAAADLARLDAAPPTLPAAEMQAVRVVVGPPAAVGHDPFLSATHPEVEPRFDRILWIDGEDLSEAEFTSVGKLGAAWVVVGTPDPAYPPGYRNGTPRPRQPFFPRLWERWHAPAWTRDGDRHLVRLQQVEPPSVLHREPLVSRPEVELRFLDRDGGWTLAEVVFPAGMPLPEARAFLAREADEVRCEGYGPAEWDATAERLRCRWPAVDAASGPRADVDLGNGVRETVVDGRTAAVAFNPANWTRESAEAWLADRTAPPPRSAVV